MFLRRDENPFSILLMIVFIGIAAYYEYPNIRWMHDESKSKALVFNYYEEKRLQSDNKIGTTLITSAELINNKYHIKWKNIMKGEEGKVIVNNKGEMEIVYEILEEEIEK